MNYSHSKLGTFEQCKYKYKLQYLDKIKVDIPDTIESYMGRQVHAALEKLYKDLQHEKMDSKEEILSHFEMLWEKEWSDKVLNNTEYSKENYKDLGKRFVAEYYDHYKPFNQVRTLGLETEDYLQLDGAQYSVRIDRLACDNEGNYYVCDYKTNKKLKAQEELDEDRQLAMYSLWVKQRFKDAKKVKLIWYFLAFDKEMISERSEEQLLALKQSTEALIHEVENCVEFPTNVNPLCNWCVYKSICPAWKHEIALEKKTPEEFKKDDGVKLVDEYAELLEKEGILNDKRETLKEKLIAYAQQYELEAVWGTEKKVSVKTFDKVEYPKTPEFIELLKKEGVYEELAVVNSQRFSSLFRQRGLSADILKQLKTEKGWTVRVSRRKEI
ncbi:MAG TPA: PD-(D/E)XK nuclease family protein [Candidatus Nanoarchaeia archaeon]|nr:PD-(D/E)XK nuclease family protein [Candidatus Nanoarchaeia archaeon]